MNKRKTKKKFKTDLKNSIKVGVSLTQCDKCKQDSIAHKIKSYFEHRTITNMMLFKWDDTGKKLLVSRKQLIYLLSLCNDIEILQNYDMEIVDEINIYE